MFERLKSIRGLAWSVGPGGWLNPAARSRYPGALRRARGGPEEVTNGEEKAPLSDYIAAAAPVTEDVWAREQARYRNRPSSSN